MGGVLFDGATVIRPQARVRVDTQGLVPTVLGAANVLMMFGSAQGGEPKKVLAISDPEEARRVLRGGNLLKAALKAWAPSGELPGASTIRFVRIDPALRSSLNLLDGAAATLVTLTSLDWGAHTTSIRTKVEAGSVSGKKITVEHTVDEITEVFDNLADVDAAVAAINNGVTGSVLVSAAKIAGGTLANVAYTNLAGGTDGTPTNSDWSAGFALMGASASNVYFPATSDASVHALLVAQLAIVQATKLPGFVILGHASGQTKAQVETLAEVYASNPDVVMVSPGIKHFDDAGAVVTEPSFLSAAPQLAGLICGLPVQRPATFKTLSGLGLETDYTQAELDSLEQNGIAALENVPNRGLRIVHGQTTWTGDLNPAKREISVGRIKKLLSVELKTGLEAFVGEPGTVFTIAAIKAKVESIMTEARNNSLITDGVDNAGNPQPAFRNILVKFNSATGIATVEVEASPVTPINYVLVTAHFRATNLVA